MHLVPQHRETIQLPCNRLSDESVAHCSQSCEIVSGGLRTELPSGGKSARCYSATAVTLMAVELLEYELSSLFSTNTLASRRIRSCRLYACATVLYLPGVTVGTTGPIVQSSRVFRPPTYILYDSLCLNSRIFNLTRCFLTPNHTSYKA